MAKVYQTEPVKSGTPRIVVRDGDFPTSPGPPLEFSNRRLKQSQWRAY
ncbi:MAG: hypothetical protein VX929_04210 [Pseudomonadota bacterium]|nr:hypothetical protein [Pseudomonadota bacterium]